MAIEEGDFVEIEYEGRLLDDGELFDTTDPKLAKEEGIWQEQGQYGPLKIVVGEEHILPGLEDALEGREPGEFEVELEAEEAFGKKDSDLLSIVPEKEFKKRGIQPFVGMEANIDNQRGTVRSVSGGRVVVDFNHPLAGKDVKYEVEINRIIEDEEEQVETILDLMQMPYAEFELEDDKATVKLEQSIPDDIKEKSQDVMERLTDIELEFEEPEEDQSAPMVQDTTQGGNEEE